MSHANLIYSSAISLRGSRVISTLALSRGKTLIQRYDILNSEIWMHLTVPACHPTEELD